MTVSVGATRNPGINWALRVPLMATGKRWLSSQEWHRSSSNSCRTEIKPVTIFHHAYAGDPPTAMLAGMRPDAIAVDAFKATYENLPVVQHCARIDSFAADARAFLGHRAFHHENDDDHRKHHDGE